VKHVRDFAAGFGFDKYTRQARLKPSLIVLLPLFVTLAIWLPEVWTLLGGLTAIVSTCGLTLLLAEVARFQGRKVELEMIASNGGKFTTLFLRHRDSTVSTATKKTYHSFLKKASKRNLPSFESEETDPWSADDCYRGAVEWLLEATRGEKRFPLVRAENISYGFRRNLFGLKMPAMFLIALCIAASGSFCIRHRYDDPTRFWAGSLLCLALVAAGIIWLNVITMAFVEDGGRSYALRLLAQCDVLQSKSAAKSRKHSAADENA
jgi:hypothetical protein